jgi:hypothetical protein
VSKFLASTLCVIAAVLVLKLGRVLTAPAEFDPYAYETLR